MTFKVGDKVRRISLFGGAFQDRNMIWEVSHTSGESLRVNGSDWYLANRFELVEDAPSLTSISAGTATPDQGGNNDEWLKSYCNRYKNGQCQSSACLTRGGYTIGKPYYDQATCEAHEILTELGVLRANQIPIAEATKAWIDPGEGWRLLGDEEVTVVTDERAYSDLKSHDWLALNSIYGMMIGTTLRRLRETWKTIFIRRRIEVPKPQPPAESPGDWVEITDPEHVLRDDDEMNANLDTVAKDGIANSVGWVSVKNMNFYDIAGKKFRVYPSMQLRCRRRDLPVTPETMKITFHQVIHDWIGSRSLGWVEDPSFPGDLLTGETCVVEIQVKK